MTTPTLSRSAVLLATGALLCAAAACETTVTDTPVPVASIDVAAPRTTIDRGQTVQLTATPRSASGRAMTVRPVTWTSSNASILSVNGSGLATGTGTGVATVTARSEGVENSVSITVRSGLVAVTVMNLLVSPIAVQINSQSVGVVDALSTRVFEAQRPATLTVGWNLVRPRTQQGAEIGENVGGDFPVDPDPADAVTYEIDNEVGTDTYFAPFITNQSGVPYLMGVNMELAAENRCQCEVLAGSINTQIGYYRLFSNSNVRAYRSGSGYVGTYVFWENFTANVLAGSGRLNLVSNLVPTAGGVPVAGYAALAGPPADPAASGPIRRDDRPRR